VSLEWAKKRFWLRKYSYFQELGNWLSEVEASNNKGEGMSRKIGVKFRHVSRTPVQVLEVKWKGWKVF
jgi:hypothetical protein